MKQEKLMKVEDVSIIFHIYLKKKKKYCYP